ncbi:CotH kinase family protein [Candidatus Sumerlaeota bacterium]|nr:CotH kinase family protein [Candidatus Sumerlaeota bacterium]
MKNLAILLTLLLCLTPLISLAADIYVDDDDGAPEYQETGTFFATANVGTGWNGGNYRYTKANSGLSTATWAPTFPETNNYEVFTIFRRNTDRATVVPYTINHAGGSSIINVNQNGSSALVEISLGTYTFNQGLGGNVVMSNVPSAGNEPYISDTIRFHYTPKPKVEHTRIAPVHPQDSEAFTALARISSPEAVTQVQVHWSDSVTSGTGSTDAFDDGTHNDGAAGDGLYGAAMPGFAAGNVVTFHFEVTDASSSVTVGSDAAVTIGESENFTVTINEIVASNDNSAFDLDFGDAGDWVELYNAGPDVADLTGYALSDTDGTPAKWLFPPGISIAPNGFLMVWCDDANMEGLELHTNFKLSAGGEEAVLYNTTTSSIVDMVTFPGLATDDGYARNPDGSGTFQQTIITTPGAPNVFGMRGAMPQFSAPSGLYSSTISVTITAPGSTEIRYSLDGSEPSGSSTLYGSPVSISSTTGLRARAFYPVDAPSNIATASYMFVNVPDRQIPVMNLIIDPDHLYDPITGLFVNYDERGEEWERPGYAVFMDPDGTNVHENGIGVRINGGTSRAAAKKSLRLYTRSSLGTATWSLPWLEKTTAHSFNNLVLRANNNDGILNASPAQLNQVTFFRDQLMRDFSGEQGAVGVDGFFFALYINGQYWGLYNACERITNDYMEEKAGGSDWDVVKGTWDFTNKYYMEAIDGDLTEWNNFHAWFDAANVATPAGLAGLKQRFDYYGFLKYFALNIGASNQDWPQNNFVVTRRRGDPTAKWAMHENDAEWALGLRPQGYNTDDTFLWAQGGNFMTSPGHNFDLAPLSKIFNGSDLDPSPPPSPVNGILDNPQGSKDFVSAVEETFNFEFEPTHAIAAMDAYANRIASEVPREANRWLAPSAATSFANNWPTAVQNMRNYFTNRPAYIRNQVLSKFGLSGLRTITFNKAGTGDGRMEIYGRVVSLPWTGVFFDSSELHLAALADTGSQFNSWSGFISETNPEIDHVVTTGSNATVTLTFDPQVASIQPNDVIFNEYWVNDNGTSYTTVNGAISGDWVELLTVRDDLDLRGWRVTNNTTLTQQDGNGTNGGSVLLPGIASLEHVPAGTIILIVNEVNATNTATFPADDLDASDQRLRFYAGNGNLDNTTDPGFAIGNSNEAIILLAPGATSSFADDVGVDFISEGSVVTPALFFGVASPAVQWPTPFSGIGGDDGAIFINTTAAGNNNDDGTEGGVDGMPGPGGWIVDPSSVFSGDAAGTNIVTPGGPNMSGPTPTPTPSPTPSPTASATPSLSPTPTDSPTPTPSVTATASPTASPTPGLPSLWKTY